MIGYYVTMKRDVRTAWLLGPYTEHAEALAQVGRGCQLARDVDPFTDFDAFGTARLSADHMPPGILED